MTFCTKSLPYIHNMQRQFTLDMVHFWVLPVGSSWACWTRKEAASKSSQMLETLDLTERCLLLIWEWLAKTVNVLIHEERQLLLHLPHPRPPPPPPRQSLCPSPAPPQPDQSFHQPLYRWLCSLSSPH